MVQRYLIAAALLASGGSLAAAQDVPVTDVSGQPANEGAFNVFRGISGPIENEVSDNDYSNNEAPPTPAIRNKSLREAMARANADKNPSLQMTEDAIQEARDIIETSQEMTERNKIAANRALSQGAHLSKLKMDHTNFFTPEDSKQIDESYRKVMTYDAQRKAEAAAQQQAIENIKAMAARDPVQAQLLLDNLQYGGAEEVHRRNMAAEASARGAANAVAGDWKNPENFPFAIVASGLALFLLGLFLIDRRNGPRVDGDCLAATGEAIRQRLEDSLQTYCAVNETTIDQIDIAIRRSVEAQMMVVSLSTSLYNYCLTDAYYDAGKASMFTGMPKVRFRHDDVRSALHLAWADLPACILNLDMRYRYFYVNELASSQEQQLWARMERWSEYKAQRIFQFQQNLGLGWLNFIMALDRGDVTAVNEVLDNLNL